MLQIWSAAREFARRRRKHGNGFPAQPCHRHRPIPDDDPPSGNRLTNSTPSTSTGRLLIGAGGVVVLPMLLSALWAEFAGTVTVLMTHTATSFLPATANLLSSAACGAAPNRADVGQALGAACRSPIRS